MVGSASFLPVFVAMGWGEGLVPRRVRGLERAGRWPANLGIATLNTLLVRLILPAGVVGFAIEARKHGWGLLNNVPFPYMAAILVTCVIFDLASYLQHVMIHAQPPLWRGTSLRHPGP